ncbi:CpsD/CapB family tyrosine-protein kinase [bacterium]|nr:CpsD/CapB family tyrosine-protein kinase [bacterium]
MHEKPGSAAADSIRTLRGSIEFMCGGHPPKTLLVTSASRGDGKSTVAANIAISLAQKGRATLLIDADLQGGILRRMFDLNGEAGLAEMLASGHAGVEEYAVSTSIPRLCVMPSGTPPANASDLLDAEALRHVLGSAAAHFDHVVIDSPSLRTLADAGVLALHVDAAIVVARPNRTPREEFMEIHRLLSVVGARVIGVVLNNARPEPIRIHETHAPARPDRVLHDGDGYRRKSERMAAAGPAGGYYDLF